MWFARAYLLLVDGCGGAVSRPEAARASQPAAWRELTSEHFTIWTDTTPERARSLVPTMENLRQVVLGVSGLAESKSKSFVIAFDSVDEVHEYVPSQFIAYAMSPNNLLHESVIVLAGESLDDDREIVTHELTHVIMYSVIANQPTWFAEGIAGYFETVQLHEQRANLEIGVPLEGRVATLREERARPIEQVFACTQPTCEDQRFYATTWALFTYLLNEHPRELARYMDALAATAFGQPVPSWTTVVPSLPPAKLDSELATWLAYGHIRVSRYNIKLRDWPVTERPISQADALAGKGALRFLMSREHIQLPEIDKSLELDPLNLLANLVEAAHDRDIDADRAHRLAEAHPDDWRAWWLAWRVAKTFEESREAREKTCSLSAAAAIAVPVEACTRPAPTEDTRRQVFMAATPQINACLRQSKPKDLASGFTVDVDLDDAGGVMYAHVEMGSPATNTCVEDVLKGLSWPAQHAGTFHLSAKGKSP